MAIPVEIGPADPIRNFRYAVTIDSVNGYATGAVCGFMKVSGLKQAVAEIDYREGNYKFGVTVKKTPGLVKYDDVAFSRGWSPDSQELLKWTQNIAGVPANDIVTQATLDGQEGSSDAGYKGTIRIDVYDKGDVSSGEVSPRIARTVTLLRAWPKEISTNELNAAGNEVWIQNLVVAHEGIHWGKKLG